MDCLWLAQGRFRVEYDIGTVEKLTLTAADRRLNVSFMKISYPQGARN